MRFAIAGSQRLCASDEQTGRVAPLEAVIRPHGSSKAKEMKAAIRRRTHYLLFDMLSLHTSKCPR